MQKKFKIIIIHGTGGDPNGNWFPWLKNSLIRRDHEVFVPAFPTLNGQCLSSWRETFYNQVGSIDSSTILIGHSLGAGFILSLLEESLGPIGATFLICGFLGKLGLPAYDSLNESFVCRDFDWSRIRKNHGECFLVNTDNDPYVPLANAEDLAQRLAVPITLLPGAKHLNKEAGFTSFPFLLEKIQALEEKI